MNNIHKGVWLAGPKPIELAAYEHARRLLTQIKAGEYRAIAIGELDFKSYLAAGGTLDAHKTFFKEAK